MLIVGVSASEVESTLRAGVGPPLPAGARCPDCGGELGPWGGKGYPRFVRFAGLTSVLRVRRAICRGCRGTHALLPSFVCPRRLDAASAIGEAIEQAAAGAGHRPIAASLALPETTVRGWLRRARAGATPTASCLWRLVQALGGDAPRPPPGERPLAALLRAAERAFALAALRFGSEALPDLWGFVVAVTGGRLIAHTSSP